MGHIHCGEGEVVGGVEGAWPGTRFVHERKQRWVWSQGAGQSK